MDDDKYLRTIEDLEKIGSKWWPKEVREEANRVSILRTLLDTQEEFISILKLTTLNPLNLIQLINLSPIRLNMFLKHLAILTDFGAEPMKRINTSFADVFPTGTLDYKIGDENYSYTFKALPVHGTLDNKKMKIDTKEHLINGKYDSELCEDLIMMLVFGGCAVTHRARAILYKCNVSDLIGKKKEIETYIRTNYIRVSRILAGKEANDLGNVAESYVVDYLKNKLGHNYNVQPHGHIPNITDNDGKTLITFDIVVDRKDDNGKYKKHIGIEISFQETTNSVVERKGGEAESRFAKIVQTRNYIAYIIDGGGNFERKNAMSDLCRFSHCNVAYTPEEFDLLITFIKEKLG